MDLDSVTCTDSESETLESENSDLDISFGIRVNQVKRKPPKTNIIISGLKCRLLVDSGNSINLLNESLLNKNKSYRSKEKLQRLLRHLGKYQQQCST